MVHPQQPRPVASNNEAANIIVTGIDKQKYPEQ